MNGKDFVVGFKPEELASHIRAHKGAQASIKLDANRAGNRIDVTVSPSVGNVAESSIYVVTIDPHQSVDIRRGENAGRTIDYYNIVTSWTRIGIWDGRSKASFAAKLPNDEDAVVLVQPTDYGPLLAAASSFLMP